MTASFAGSGSGWWRRRFSRLLVLVLLALASGVGLAGPASAHNVLISSDPAEGATLQSAPATVRLTFDQPVQDFQPVLAVIGPGDQHFESGAPQVDSTVVTATVGALPVAGAYVIAYRVVSADGHPVAGEVHFQLAEVAALQPSAAPASGTSGPAGGASASSNPTPSATTGAATTGAATTGAGGSSGLSGWVWAAVAVAAILVIAAIVVIVRRPGQPD